MIAAEARMYMSGDSPLICIAVEGCVGAGKTTVARLLSEQLGAAYVAERIGDIPFLSKFYQRPSQYALETELSFVLSHYHHLRDALCAAEVRYLVSDYHIAKDVLFAEMNLSAEELRVFNSVYDFVAPRLPAPRAVICLHCDDELILKRIKERNRQAEVTADPSYFRRLNRAYEEFLAGLPEPKVHVDMAKRDFRADGSDLRWLLQEIIEYLQ